MSFRIKHVKSGLYYQPITNGNNLSKNGKIYNSLASVRRSLGSDGLVSIEVKKDSSAHELSKKYIKYSQTSWNPNAFFTNVPTAEFVAEELDLDKKFTTDDILLAMGFSYGLTSRVNSFEEHKAECIRYVEKLNELS